MTSLESKQSLVESENSENVKGRYIVGIDLGTTNSAVTYVDTLKKKWEIRTFAIPQFVAAGLVESRETLPSFYYEPYSDELTPEQLRLPFGEKKAKHVVGVFARDHGGKVIGRLVSSAKSWLCHAGVDRTSKLLPWQAADGVTQLSPVDVTARYLAHIRFAWDHAFAKFPLTEQDMVITLPASFDEVARELTIRAARQAGIPKIVLLEEPQAAFYAWVYTHADNWQALVTPGQKILVCDIGGGTTDLTLIRVCAEKDGAVRFHRVAVGEHLILGGDNLDLALAHHLESRLVGQGKLPPNSWGLLVRIACSIKEKLLGDDAPEKMTVSIPGIGSKLIAGSRQLEVTRDEVEALLIDGFMPLVPLSSKPSRRLSGVREFGLPYASDHAITRYLAHFLTTHQYAGKRKDECAGESAVPDIVLLNGGMFEAKKMQRRLLEQLAAWEAETSAECKVQSAELNTKCEVQSAELNTESKTQRRKSKAQNAETELAIEGDAITGNVATGDAVAGDAVTSNVIATKWGNDQSHCVLENRRLDLAVARGAAYYGMVRRGFGERISAGLARTYYIGIDVAETNRNATDVESVCGVEKTQIACDKNACVDQDANARDAASQNVGARDADDQVDTCNADAASPKTSTMALCLLAAGTDVDYEVTLADRSFELLVNTPIQFPIYVSSVRLTDQTGDLVSFEPEQMSALPPIQTVIKPKPVASSRHQNAKSDEVEHSNVAKSNHKSQLDAKSHNKSKKTIVVQIKGKLTEVGTLELWCVEKNDRGRWRLDFDVRSVAETDRDAVSTTAEREGIIDEADWEPIRQTLAATFAPEGTDKPTSLMRQLDAVSGIRRDDWPTSLLRRIGDELLEAMLEGRRKSPEHEARWLNLIGYAYRPGFGLTLDDWRIEQLWRKVQGNIVGKTQACRLQGWVLWRRVAGGLTVGQQKTIADPLFSNVRNLHRQSTIGLGRGADIDLYSQEGAEIWRLIGSLELLPVETKIELGDMILDLFLKKRAAPVYDAMIWAVGRLGARELLYGPLNTVVPPQTAEKWLRKIASHHTTQQHDMRHDSRQHVIRQSDLLTIMQLARKTDDRYRDLTQTGRDIALNLLEHHSVQSGAQKHLATLVREVAQLDTDEQVALFGETLPVGLRMVTGRDINEHL